MITKYKAHSGTPMSQNYTKSAENIAD